MTYRSATVFVVDDDPSVRRALERLLQSVGYRVESYGTAREFLGRVPAHSAGCLVLDVRMPGESGFALFETLRAEGFTLPVVFIAGHGDVPMAVRAIKAGAVDFLTKPFEDQMLLDAIAQALAQDSRRAEPTQD
jgi:two-component system response regulator FixJ